MLKDNMYKVNKISLPLVIFMNTKFINFPNTIFVQFNLLIFRKLKAVWTFHGAIFIIGVIWNKFNCTNRLFPFINSSLTNDQTISLSILSIWIIKPVIFFTKVFPNFLKLLLLA